LGSDPTGKFSLSFIPGDQERGPGGGEFHADGLLDGTQMLILTSEKVVEKTVILELQPSSVSARMFQVRHSPPLCSFFD
jgi:hypothetical protein